MFLEFKSDRLKKKCLKGCLFGDKNTNILLTKRLRELNNAPHLLDIKKIKKLNLHKLKGSRKFEMAIDLDGRKNPLRIVFVQVDGENVFDDFLNDSKFETITKIKILEITDYHK